MDTPTTAAKDKRVEIAIHHWAPRFVSSGVPLTDFQEVTAGVSRWDERCGAWSARAAIHEELGRSVLADGFRLSASEHLTRAALCYHFGKFMNWNRMSRPGPPLERGAGCSSSPYRSFAPFSSRRFCFRNLSDQSPTNS